MRLAARDVVCVRLCDRPVFLSLKMREVTEDLRRSLSRACALRPLLAEADLGAYDTEKFTVACSDLRLMQASEEQEARTTRYKRVCL